MIFLMDQIRTFLFMLIFGFVVGMTFNLYQIILHRFNFKRFIVHISDIIFSLILGVSGFILLICVNHGNMRFYVILAIILGFCIYNYLAYSIRKNWMS